jgi:hypothetical protein
VTQIGWREFRGYMRVMREEARASGPDPERWTDASRDNIRSLDELRERRRGR